MKTIEALDTRDLYTRKCELEALRDAVESARDDLSEAGFPAGTMRSEIPEEFEHLIVNLDAAKEDYDQDAQDELAELETLENEVGVSNFMHGTQLIPDCEFEDYARELAEDVYGDAALREWPGNCIDWKQAAEELQQDYSIASYQGTDYYFQG